MSAQWHGPAHKGASRERRTAKRREAELRQQRAKARRIVAAATEGAK